jgi:predicted aspartyl protease
MNHDQDQSPMLVSGTTNGMKIHVLLDTGTTRSLFSHQLAHQYAWTSTPVNETIAVFDGNKQHITPQCAVPLQLGNY